MTLIPILSAFAANPRRAPEPAGTTTPARFGYDGGAGHRPVAAMLAVGLPIALVAAVALSPMVIDQAPTTESKPWTSVFLPDPPPPPDPAQDTKPTPKSASVTEAVKPVVDTFPQTDLGTEVKPFVPDLTPYDPAPPAKPADPPAAPKLVLAELDSRYAGSFQPDYPASEQRREIEGRAKVRVLIGANGRVKAVELISSDSPGFFEETKRRALAKWRFTPATRGGVAEESWKVMTVTFQIRNG